MTTNAKHTNGVRKSVSKQTDTKKIKKTKPISKGGSRGVKTNANREVRILFPKKLPDDEELLFNIKVESEINSVVQDISATFDNVSLISFDENIDGDDHVLEENFSAKNENMEATSYSEESSHSIPGSLSPESPPPRPKSSGTVRSSCSIRSWSTNYGVTAELAGTETIINQTRRKNPKKTKKTETQVTKKSHLAAENANDAADREAIEFAEMAKAQEIRRNLLLAALPMKTLSDNSSLLGFSKPSIQEGPRHISVNDQYSLLHTVLPYLPVRSHSLSILKTMLWKGGFEEHEVRIPPRSASSRFPPATKNYLSSTNLQSSFTHVPSESPKQFVSLENNCEENISQNVEEECMVYETGTSIIDGVDADLKSDHVQRSSSPTPKSARQTLFIPQNYFKWQEDKCPSKPQSRPRTAFHHKLEAKAADSKSTIDRGRLIKSAGQNRLQQIRVDREAELETKFLIELTRMGLIEITIVKSLI
jgi:hypothetical protein